ncbi:MAG: GNAT family N-acetyltransferase, partial [Planctomycetes bacterium]|nr:GNAT family N-acetyltransferase [Planctomycetota bacterium]
AQATDRVPACEQFARAIGSTPGLEMKTSQLDLRAVDREKVAAWAAMSPAGYRLERIDDTVPADLVAPYIEATHALNDMPQGDMKVNPARLTAQQIRDRESTFLQSGDRLWIVVAIHEKTGAGVGFTEATWNPRISHVVGQVGTAVVESHRGHRLGLWMKATMLKRILEDCPEAKVIRTGNANVNARMLALNTELGFVKAWSLTVWQLTLAAARKAVGLEG